MSFCRNLSHCRPTMSCGASSSFNTISSRASMLMAIRSVLGLPLPNFVLYTQTYRFKRTWTHVHVRYMSSSVRPSVVCLFVTFVRLTQTIEIFGNVSSPFDTLAICWLPGKILRRSSQGNPSVAALNARAVAKYSDFGPTEGYIPETVQDRR